MQKKNPSRNNSLVRKIYHIRWCLVPSRGAPAPLSFSPPRRFCLRWHAVEASCSSRANSESLQAAANLRYTWAFKAVIRRVDDLTLGFTQEVLMCSEQIAPSLEEKYEEFFLSFRSLPLTVFDEGLTGFRGCTCKRR